MSSNQRDSDRDNFFLFAALVGCVLWISSVSPLRIWATRVCQCGSWIFGVTPNFFAGVTFAFWQAFAVKSRPLASVMYAAALVTAAEIIQLYIPRYTFDVWDMVAGVVGVAVALPVLLWRERRRRQEAFRLDRNKTVELKQKF
ncbi:MAG: hypothetical protein ABSC53_02980 [Bacteroidota bacterium]